MKKIILASASERRSDLLKLAGIEFSISVSDVDENIIESDPEKLVKRLAFLKAASVAEAVVEDAVIIGADTIVYLDGEILGKPKDEQDARRILQSLSGRTHQVYTGLCVINKTGEALQTQTIADIATVYMRTLSEQDIANYIESGEPMGKAGAYAIQGRAALFVDRIEGDFYTIVGLPISKLWAIIKQII